MNFTDFKNGALIDTVGMFTPQPVQTIPTADFYHPLVLDTGCKVQPNGDVDFGYYAPDAKKVTIAGLKAEELEMEKHDDGTWHYLLKYEPPFCGAKAFWFMVDGMEVVSQYCPTFYSMGHYVNYVEIPDANADFIYMRKDVAHGVTVTDYFWSEALNEYRRVLIYLPPGYDKGSDYPVLYLQHGHSENETSWTYNGKVLHIMDNLIAEGKITPFIVVMGNGMIYRPGDPVINYELFAENMIGSMIPFIDGKYKTKADKWHRAIAGFSLGSVQSCVTGMNHPETFSHIGMLSGFMRKVGGVHENDMSFETHTHLKPLLDKEYFEKEYKLFYRGIGTADFKYKEIFLPDDQLCAENGIDKYSNYCRFTIEGYPHDWSTMRILLHDFAQHLFK